MDWKHTFKTFYEWETDDTFIPTGDKYLSSYNIDPVSNPRYLQLSPRFITWNSLTTTADITEIVALPWNAYIYLWAGNVFYNSTERTSTIAGTSYAKAWYLYDNTWALKVYVFDATNIYRMNSDLSTKEATTAHATGTVTSICQATNTLVYAVWNTLYQIDNSWVVSTVLRTLPYGITVKWLYFYNDILYVFTQDWPNTKIFQCRYNGSSYDIIYWHIKKDIYIYDMAWSGGNIYWVSSYWLYQTDWTDSRLIKKKFFSSSSRCSLYTDNFLYIADWAIVYRYWTDLPWFPKAFIQYVTHSWVITCVSWFIFSQWRSAWSVDTLLLAWRSSIWEIITMPYDASALWADKNLEVICFPYELKTGNSGASIQIQMQTNLMELDNSATFNNILTLSDLSNDVGICRIDASQILTAMGSKTPNFSWVKFKIILNRSTSTEYSPKVYQDIYIAWSFINDSKVIW